MQSLKIIAGISTMTTRTEFFVFDWTTRVYVIDAYQNIPKISSDQFSHHELLFEFVI